MAFYVDGFVIPVPKKKLAAYKKMAKLMGTICMKYGALAYNECVEDDVKKGKWTSFPQAVKLKKGEVVVFSWAIYKTKAQRNVVNKKMMKDPKLAKFMDPKNWPFDGKRMFMGGFKSMISF